jgi:hypothetical protein
VKVFIILKADRPHPGQALEEVVQRVVEFRLTPHESKGKKGSGEKWRTGGENTCGIVINKKGSYSLSPAVQA